MAYWFETRCSYRELMEKFGLSVQNARSVVNWCIEHENKNHKLYIPEYGYPVQMITVQSKMNK